MPVFENTRTGRRMTVSGAAAEDAYTADPEWSPVVEVPAPATLKVDDLRAALAALGLSVDGKKDELVARLEAAQAPAVKPLSEDEQLLALELGLGVELTEDADPAAVRLAIEAKLAAGSAS